MTIERRGGPRVPDGVQRPSSLPFSRGPNRSDMAELPGTPGTALPPSPVEPQRQMGQASRLRQILQGIPLERAAGSQGLTGPTEAPNEPVTAGNPLGPGPGPSSIVPNQNELSQRLTAEQMRYMYPLIMRLATLPDATDETKFLAQRIRANLPVAPEQMPATEPNIGIR